jgi:hypothetical protein
MTRKDFVGLWIGWPYQFGDTRSEFHLLRDGRFEQTLFDSGRKISVSALGTWDVIGDVLQWTYESCKGAPRPRRPERDKILEAEENRFVLLGSSDVPQELWRGVPGDDTSTNFDLDEVQPFLKRLVKFVDAGFASREITSAMKKIRKLEPEKRLQMVFPITFHGDICPFYISAFMDDIGAPDICFSGPVEFVRLIDDEIKKFDTNLEG